MRPIRMTVAIFSGTEMKMNTNGGLRSDGIGPYCYLFTTEWTATANLVSNDFIGITHGITFNGTVKVMTSHLCGIYDPLEASFPLVTSNTKSFLHNGHSMLR